jgi:hypothetical protein
MVTVSKASWHYRISEYVYGPGLISCYTPSYLAKVEYSPSVFRYSAGVLWAVLISPFIFLISRQFHRQDSPVARGLGTITGIYALFLLPMLETVVWPNVTVVGASYVILAVMLVSGRKAKLGLYTVGTGVLSRIRRLLVAWHHISERMKSKYPRVTFEESR